MDTHTKHGTFVPTRTASSGVSRLPIRSRSPRRWPRPRPPRQPPAPARTPWRTSGGSAFALLDLLEGGPLVDGQVVGLVAFDDVPRLLLGGVPLVALEDDLRGYFLLDRAPDPA